MGQRTQIITIFDLHYSETNTRSVAVIHGQWGWRRGLLVDTMNFILSSSLCGHTGIQPTYTSTETKPLNVATLPNHMYNMTSETDYYTKGGVLKANIADIKRTAGSFMRDILHWDNNNGAAIVWTMYNRNHEMYNVFYGFLAGPEETEKAFSDEADFLTADQYMHSFISLETGKADDNKLLVKLFNNAVMLSEAKLLNKNMSFQKWLKEN